MQTIANNCKQLQTIANNCKQLQTIANKLTISFLLGSLTLSSCNENEAEESLSEIMSRQVIQEVDFFELEKGDTLPKYIYRRKPEFTEEDDIEILCSTENYENQNNVKLWSCTGENPLDLSNDNDKMGKSYDDGFWDNKKYIKNIKMFVSDKKEYSTRYAEDPNTHDKYRTMLVDLNEGAGGKYIYLKGKKYLTKEELYTYQICSNKNDELAWYSYINQYVI